MLRFDDPLNSCEYFDERLCYAVSTTFTLAAVDLQRGEKVKEVRTVQHDEHNEYYLVDAGRCRNSLVYFTAHKEDNTRHILQWELDGHQSNVLATA